MTAIAYVRIEDVLGQALLELKLDKRLEKQTLTSLKRLIKQCKAEEGVEWGTELDNNILAVRHHNGLRISLLTHKLYPVRKRKALLHKICQTSTKKDSNKAVETLVKEANFDGKKLEDSGAELLVNRSQLKFSLETNKAYLRFDEESALDIEDGEDDDRGDGIVMHRIVDDMNNVADEPERDEQPGFLNRIFNFDCIGAIKRKFIESRVCRYSIFTCLGLTVAGGIVGAAVGIALSREN